MSKDLSFWKYEQVNNSTHKEVYEKLSNGEKVPGISILPISDIKKKIQETFWGWDKLDDTHLENSNEMIEIFTTEQFVRFDCYSVTEENMNKLIDIMLEYDCRLYDSAIDVRFD